MRLSLRVFCVVIIAGTIAALTVSVAQEKNDADKLYNEGNARYKSGNFQGAIEKYTEALNIVGDYRYHYQRGLSFKNSRQYDKAISDFEAAISLKKDFAIGYNALGGVHLMTGDFDKSIESFKLASKNDPRLDRSRKGIGEAYAGKAQQLLDAGRFEAAGALLDEALAEHSENAKLYLIAARVYNRLENPEKSIGSAQEAIKLKKRGAMGAEYFELGIGYKKLNDFGKARAAFIEAKKDPSYSRNAQYELDGLKGR